MSKPVFWPQKTPPHSPRLSDSSYLKTYITQQRELRMSLLFTGKKLACSEKTLETLQANSKKFALSGADCCSSLASSVAEFGAASLLQRCSIVHPSRRVGHGAHVCCIGRARRDLWPRQVLLCCRMRLLPGHPQADIFLATHRSRLSRSGVWLAGRAVQSTAAEPTSPPSPAGHVHAVESWEGSDRVARGRSSADSFSRPRNAMLLLASRPCPAKRDSSNRA